MSLQVLFLGVGSATPILNRHPPGQYIQYQGINILIDCGEGTQYQMLKYRKSAFKLDAIFISHLHADHCMGLPPLLSTLSLQKRSKPLWIIGPWNIQSWIEASLMVDLASPPFPIYFKSLKQNNMTLCFKQGKLSVFAFPLSHSIPTFGYLLVEKDEFYPLNIEAIKKDNIPIAAYQYFKRGENYVNSANQIFQFKHYTTAKKSNKLYAYCADTKYTDSYQQYLRDVVLLYHEATYLQDDTDKATLYFHSTASQAAEVAKNNYVNQLVLGHYSSRYKTLDCFLDQAKLIFAETILGKEGLSIYINGKNCSIED